MSRRLSKPVLRPGNTLRVKNTSGETIPQGGVVWINGQTTDSAGVGVFVAAKPDSDNADHSFFIALTDMGDGQVGYVTREPCWASYETVTPTVDDEIGPTNGSWYLGSGTGFKVIADGVDGFVYVVPPIGVPGPAGSGGMITVELPSDLTLVQGTKASCTVKATFSGGPSIGTATITVTNPPAKGGNYQWKATAATQYVNAIFQGGSEYLICSVQHVTQQVLYDLDWTSPNLTQDRKDLWVAFADNDGTDTVLTGDASCPAP